MSDCNNKELRLVLQTFYNLRKLDQIIKEHQNTDSASLNQHLEKVIRCEHLQILLKEVIQPQVPLGLPCYDFTPVINHTVVSAQF